MWIRFSDILQPTQYHEKVGPVRLDMGFHYQVEVGPVVLDLEASPVEGGHRFQGTFPYSATAPCVRCLKPVALSGTASFDLLYRPAKDAPPEEEDVDVDATQEGAQFVFYEEETLPLEDLVSQQMYLEIPEKVLCGEGCKGLCPRCGSDLNEGPCPCPPEQDSRWAELSQIVKDKKES